MTTHHEDRVLRALRRISRAVDQHSRRLAESIQVTGPQLVCLREIIAAGEITPGRLSAEVALSKATLTGIVDRLTARGLIERERDKVDRRRVLIRATPEGEKLSAAAPSPLQDKLSRNLERLSEEQREQVSHVLEAVVRMMEAEHLDASPLFATGPILATAKDVIGLLDSGTERGS